MGLRGRISYVVAGKSVGRGPRSISSKSVGPANPLLKELDGADSKGGQPDGNGTGSKEPEGKGAPDGSTPEGNAVGRGPGKPESDCSNSERKPVGRGPPKAEPDTPVPTGKQAEGTDDGWTNVPDGWGKLVDVGITFVLVQAFSTFRGLDVVGMARKRAKTSAQERFFRSKIIMADS